MSNNHKSRAKEAKLHIQAIQTILKRWDPMNLEPGEFAPADEYNSYAPHIVSLVAQGYSAEQILDHLQGLRSGMVCMRENPQHDVEIADEIIATLRSNPEGNSK